ncbi:metalloprotease MEP1 [Colletotrichum graminicola M1.001]|uniref:Metalloprotease MEP1 n=1 Tax=Colletotrichum graminicola (strain M1.001 / M2 / FGSC 10212) TaxID=645133 RepID=E3Q722_COLGM|nr:metalloprotease MEP1 [Colletotrichum graminicola M1.001]EFQ26660.1 metalloprotease MEP1 [Colletotrichum graminicola M1.001]
MCHRTWARLLGVALIASVALALPSRGHTLNETPHGRPQQSQSWCSFGEYAAPLNISDDLEALERATSESPADQGATINIPVNVFILGNPETQSKLNMTSPVVRLQDSLAYGYSSLGYSFGPFNTYHIYDLEFAEFEFDTLVSHKLLKMAWRLRTGGAETLNIYLVPKMAPGLLAFALFPRILMKDSRNSLALDGVLFSHHTMTHFLSEKTTIHEVGHWLGLTHPFQGGCLVPDGDGVPDTPQTDFKGDQECAAEKDTCPNLPGIDLYPELNFYSGPNLEDAPVLEPISKPQDPAASSLYKPASPDGP